MLLFLLLLQKLTCVGSAKPRDREGEVRRLTGGKPRISRQAVLDRLSAGDGPAAVARARGVSRMSVYRIIAEAKKSRTKPVMTSRSGKPRRLVSADAG